MPRRLAGMISALVVGFAFVLWTGVSSIASGSNPLRTAGVDCNRPASESITWADLPGTHAFQALPSNDGCSIFVSLATGNAEASDSDPAAKIAIFAEKCRPNLAPQSCSCRRQPERHGAHARRQDVGRCGRQPRRVFRYCAAGFRTWKSPFYWDIGTTAQMPPAARMSQ